MAGPELTRAAVLMATSTLWGAAVSLHRGVPGEPLRVRVPGSVLEHLLLGLGSGLSAPWPMAAVVLHDALGRRTSRGRASQGVGALLLAGVLVEPVTWGRRERSWWVVSTVVLNLLAAVALLAAGGRDR